MLKRRASRLLTIGVLLIALTILIVAIQNQNKHEPSQSQVASMASSYVAFNHIDDYISYADHIVIGTVKERSKFDSYIDEYTVTVNQQLKNETHAAELLVYTQNQELEINNQYLFFFERFEGGLYPEPIYQLLQPEVLFAIDGQHVYHQNPFLPNELSLTALLDSIQSSPGITKSRVIEPSQTNVLIKDAMSNDELIKQSDIIAHIKPSIITRTNKYMTFAQVETLESFSDKQIEKDAIVVLPAGIDADQEYLVFLKYEDGLYIVTAKTGSVIAKQDKEKWADTLHSLKKE